MKNEIEPAKRSDAKMWMAPFASARIVMPWSNYDCVGVIDKLPKTFAIEVAALQAGAKVGGTIPPRRRPGLLVEFDRLRRKYDQKIVALRKREPSHAIDEAVAALNKVAAEFSADLVVMPLCTRYCAT